MSRSKVSQEPQRMRLNNRWELIKKIGSGSFGEIYLGIDIQTGEEVAVKLEKTNFNYPQLHFESRVYKSLDKNHAGIPRILFYGTDESKVYRTLVMDLLGPSLEDLFSYCGRTFSLKTVIMLADQMLRRVSVVHAAHFIHRDLKPDNFLMGIGKSCNVVFLVDFGLAKKYMRKNGQKDVHIPFCGQKTLTGTARYASVNAHSGVEQSRRDDMESLGYIWLYFLKGVLPWQGTKAATKQQKYQKIFEKKSTIQLELLCEGTPREFLDYVKACRSMEFEQAPRYQHWLNAFANLSHEMGYREDYAYDWTLHGRRQPGSSSTFSKIQMAKSKLPAVRESVVKH